MPPRTRGAKGSKILKENLVSVGKCTSKSNGKINKPPRKVLADKTNSASDDNTSFETKKKTSHVITEIENMTRPRRERRLPTRYVGNDTFKNLSNCKVQPDSENITPELTNHKTVRSVKVNTTNESPFKTPQKSLESSLVANKPKRICRLPSRFDDHSASPSKFIPVKPCHASTPILEKKGSVVTEPKETLCNKEVLNKKSPLKRPIQDIPEPSSDSNNNAKRKLLRLGTVQKDAGTAKSKVITTRIREKDKKSPIVKTRTAKKLYQKTSNASFSFRVLENKEKCSQNEDNNLDVYEFTYDPNEEPAPAKKKRKRAVKKKPSKPVQPKTVVFKNNYDQNVGKALEVLKNVVSKKLDVPKVVISPANEKITAKDVQTETHVEQHNIQVPKETLLLDKNNVEPTQPTANVTNQIEEQIYNSVRVEDIAADFQVPMEDYNDINYSPVNTPQRPITPAINTNNTIDQSLNPNDPLNLRNDLSFFDENPVASSSMNMSSRHPQASPWRVEFNNLPIRWHVNSYVKPNMTPAVESSFINFEDNKKKHVYTNMIGHDDNALEPLQNQSNLKQTSIISFIREVVEKSAQKKKRAKSVTPTKASNLFDDLAKANNTSSKTPKKSEKIDKKSKKGETNVSSSSAKQDKECNEIRENKQKKTKNPEKDKDGTFFGFDDSEDQENVSPVKVSPKVRALRPRARAVLQQINAMSGPTRAVPLAAKSKLATNTDSVNKVFEEIKSAADAPVFPEGNEVQPSSEVTVVDEVYNDDDSQSVHLFEDIELVHHLKPTRKSYGKAKKVTFRQHSTSSGTQDLEQEEERVYSDGDDLADLTFTMPSFQPQKKAKKKSKKQMMSKKEQKALEEWAAGFNSMCEDIEDVPLNVE